MNIMIFLHGTLIMHSGAKGKSRMERVRQSANREQSVLDYGSYIPIGKSVSKLKKWKEQDARIFYLSSHENLSDVRKDRRVLNRYSFPKGRILYRKRGIGYRDIVEKIMPDVLVEDDCESIGGREEMMITKVRPAVKKRIKSVVVKEFAGIDKLPDDVQKLYSSPRKQSGYYFLGNYM